MHICFISNEYPLWATGGIGSFIQTLGRAMVQHGHKVSVVGIGSESKQVVINDEGVSIYRLPAPGLLKKARFLENVYRLRKCLKSLNKQNPIDIVESPESGMAFLPRSTPYKKVIRMHGGHHFFAQSENRPINKWKGFQEKLSYGNVDFVVAVSRYVAQRTSELLNLDKSAHVIYNFVDFKKFNYTSKRSFVKGQILFIGTVCEKKGVGKLVEAMPYILKKHPLVKLKVVGRDLINNVSGESYTQKLLSEMPSSLKDVIDFTGPVAHDKIPELISESEMVVLPSFMEAMPIAWLEVLAMGKPLVASKAGPGPEAVSHGETGLLCDPYDALDIAEKVIYIFNHPVEAQQMGARAHEYAFNNFNVEKLVNDNLAFYERICKS
jgi:glycosyltransferase involved in cell wall biosynthesis